MWGTWDSLGKAPHQGAPSPSGLLTKVPPHQGVAKATSPQISHAIPRRCESTQAQKPRNFNDPTSKPETFSGELHAKLSDAALCVPEKLHVIPPGPYSATARKPRNFNDPISIFETSSGELRAKLLCPSAAGPGHTRTKSRPIGEAAAMPAGNMGMAAEPVRGGRARVRLKINHAERSSRRGRRAGRLRGGRRSGGLPRGTAHPDR